MRIPSSLRDLRWRDSKQLTVRAQMLYSLGAVFVAALAGGVLAQVTFSLQHQVSLGVPFFLVGFVLAFLVGGVFLLPTWLYLRWRAGRDEGTPAEGDMNNDATPPS